MDYKYAIIYQTGGSTVRVFQSGFEEPITTDWIEHALKQTKCNVCPISYDASIDCVTDLNRAIEEHKVNYGEWAVAIDLQ